MDAKFTQATNAYGNVANLKTSPSLDKATPSLTGDAAPKINFDDLVAGSLDNARDAGYKGEITSVKGLTNEADLSQMVTAITNAELTLQTVVAIRDKVVGAYQDIIKMPI